MTITGPRYPDEPGRPLSLYVPGAPGADDPVSAFENPRILHPDEIDGDDWNSLDSQEAAFLREHPEEAARQDSLPKRAARFVLAEGGPYDGMEMMVDPKVDTVVKPGAFGAGDYHGPVIYRREKRSGGDRMVFDGVPDQTDAAHSDED